VNRVLVLGVLVALSWSWPFEAQAIDPDARRAYPVVPPVRERVLAVDDHVSWTLRRGEAAVPLAVVSTPGRTVVALAGGWLVLGPDLEFSSTGLALLASNQPTGSPWVQTSGGAVLFVTGSPGDLAVLYPDTSVIIRRGLDVADLSHFVLADQGLLFVQGRRASAALDWTRRVREVQPLPFFPADLASAAGTAWAADSLQARPWRQDEGFWKPLEFPKAPGRLTTLAPFPDSAGYFAGGPGWVGAFSSDGTAFWVVDRDLSGQPLPRDLKLRTGAGRLYLWSAQARKVWCWSWNPGASGTVPAPSTDRMMDTVRSEIDRLEALGSLPEAMAAAQYGVELAQACLVAQPLHQGWTRAAAEFSGRRQDLRNRIIGAGVFVIEWAAPFGVPLGSWRWEPDAAWLDVEKWRVTMKPYWEGRAYEADDFQVAPTADLSPWPGADDYHQGPLRLPSWMSLEFRPDGSAAPVHWTRVPLPSPPVPYDLPVE